MIKFCELCEEIIKDKEEIVIVARTRFKDIPSRVLFAIEMPSEVYEMQHYDCAKGDLIPDPDEEHDYEDD